MRAAVLMIVLASLAGCGEDEAPPPAKAVAANAAKPGAANTPGSKNLLPEKLHVEDRVTCTIPEQPSDPVNGKCDPKAPSCPDRTYCMTIGKDAYCEACPERDGIRHVFRERDFAGEQNRDPFAPAGMLAQNAAGTGVAPTEKCRRDDQFVASSYSYVDLKLVGIVAQGTQRKVLMMGGPLGYIIKRGDCVGKEKAVVTDIGTGYITFQIDPDPLSPSARPAQEYSVQLNPKQLAANDPSDTQQVLPRTTIAPVVAPPPVMPPGAAPRGTTVIVPGAAPAPGVTVVPGAGALPPGTPPASAAAAAAGSAPATNAPAMTGTSAVPLVVPSSPPPATGSAAAPTVTPPAAAPTTPTRVFVPAPKR